MTYNLILFKSIIYCSIFLLETQSHVRRDTIATAFDLEYIDYHTVIFP